MGFWVWGVNLNLLENVNANVVLRAYRDTGTVSLRRGVGTGIPPVGTRCPCPGTVNGVYLAVNGVGRYCLNGFLGLGCKSESAGKCGC